MSPSYTIDYHYLLENISDIAIQVFLSAICTLCSLLSPLRCPVTPRTSTISTLMTPNSIISTPMTPNSASPTLMTPAPTPGGPRDLPSHSWRCPHSISLAYGAGTKKGRPSCWNQWWLPGLRYVTLCIWPCLKISIIKRLFFFKRIHKNLEKIQKRESVS